MRITSKIVFLAAGIYFLIGCSSAHKQNKDEAVVARVGKSVLLASEINQEVPGNLSKSIRLDEKKNFVRRWINTEVLYQEAQKRGYGHLPEIERQLRNVKKSLLANMILEKQFPKKPEIPDSTIRRYYLKNRDSFVRNKNEVRFGFVLFRQKKNADVFAKLLKSGKSFGEALSAVFPKKKQLQQWDSGYISMADVPAFLSSIVKRTKIKEVAGPRKTEGGFYVLQVFDRQKAGSYRSIEEVRPKIIALLQEEKMREIYHQYINSLKDQRNIVMNLSVLEKSKSDSTRP